MKYSGMVAAVSREVQPVHGCHRNQALNTSFEKNELYLNLVLDGIPQLLLDESTKILLASALLRVK